VELPTSSCHRVLYPRYYKHVGTFSCKPPGGPEKKYYCALGYGRDVNGMGTRDWYLMHYSGSSPTEGQKHTHTVILEHVLGIKIMTSLILDHVARAYLYLGISTGEKVMILLISHSLGVVTGQNKT
jgi:hypothetical protein